MGTAMEATLHDDNIFTAGRLAGQLDRGFNRFGTTIRKEKTIDFRGSNRV